MSYIHWVARQNKLEIPRDKDEVNKREIHECEELAMGCLFIMRWAGNSVTHNTKQKSQRAQKKRQGG